MKTYASFSISYCYSYCNYILLFQSVAVSGHASVSGNNLVGKIELNYFSFDLKWSDIGKLHTGIVQVIFASAFSVFLSPGGRGL